MLNRPSAIVRCILALLCTTAVADVTLVKDGKPTATIVLPVDPTQREATAAEELQTHIKLISGATLPIAQSAPSGATINIGAAVADPQLDDIRAKSSDEAAFRIHVVADRIDLIGLSDYGTLYAAIDLLEQLGVRWFMPGPLGLDVIESKTVTVPAQTKIDFPGFTGRHLQPLRGSWPRRMRLSGLDGGTHGLGPKFDREKNPEYFIHENGKPTHQEDVSHPEVLKAVVDHWRRALEKSPDSYRFGYIPVGPHDGAGFGNHPWDGKYLDPFTGLTSMTDRYIEFFNRVLAELNKTHPDLGIGFYAYTRDIFPPEHVKPHPKILPILAPINFDRFHSIENPLSWEKQYTKDLVDGWQKTGLDLMYRGYLFNLADQGLPFSMLDLVRTDFPYYYDKNVVACRVQCIPQWSYHGPSIYMAAKVFWRPHLDFDAVLDEYFTRYFGPASQPMRAHFDIIENAYIHADYYTGNVFDVPNILTPPVRESMRRTLEQAELAAGEGNRYAQRVRLVRLGFDYGVSNIEMINAYRRGRFVEAKHYLDQIMDNIMPEMQACDPPVLDSLLPRYLKRFWAHTVTEAAARVSGENELVVLLPDEWRYIQDPYNGGEQMGLWRAGLGTQAWQPIKTATQSTSNQGLRYYKGTLWYRTTFDLDAAYADHELRVFLAGVDDTARVWINGYKLKVMTKGAAPIGRPWEFEVADAAEAGHNSIVVAVEDTRINELGTAGLTAPVMIWTPGVK